MTLVYCHKIIGLAMWQLTWQGENMSQTLQKNVTTIIILLHVSRLFMAHYSCQCVCGTLMKYT